MGKKFTLPDESVIGNPAFAHVDLKALMTNRSNMEKNIEHIKQMPKHSEYNKCYVTYMDGKTEVFHIKGHRLSESIVCFDLEDGGICWIVLQNVKNFNFEKCDE